MTAVVSSGVVRKGKVVDKTKKEKIFLYIVTSKNPSPARHSEMWEPAAAAFAVFWRWAAVVLGLLFCPHITSAAALTTLSRTFLLSFTLSGGRVFLLALRLFLSLPRCFPRKQKGGTEKRKLMLSARERRRIYLEKKTGRRPLCVLASKQYGFECE